MKYILAAALVLAAGATRAEQLDADFLQRAVASVEAQRNNALTAQTIAEAKLSRALADLEDAKTKIKELEKPTAVEPGK